MPADSATATSLWVLVVADGRRCAIPAAIAEEVVRRAAATPLPDSVPWLVGLLHARGGIEPLVDLRIRLGAASVAPALADRIVRCTTAQGPVALVVDDVEGVVDGPEMPPPTGELVVGSFAGVTGVVLLLDVEAVAREAVRAVEVAR